jgi:hypothetical protein
MNLSSIISALRHGPKQPVETHSASSEEARQWERDGPADQKTLPPIDLARQHNLARRLHYKQRADHYFYVDIVGTCNLRCPSCAVGNSGLPTTKGLMSLEDYKTVLNKIKTDYKHFNRTFIDLYNWGEPALHPELGAIIGATRKADIGVGISSNLNAVPDLRDIVKAGPDYIRISVSGFYDETYRTTHKGGNILAVKSNMYKLAELLQRYRSDTIVQVGFHVYRGNFPRDFLAMRALCDELNFIFAPILATLMPAEKAVQIALGDTSGVERTLLDNLVIPVDESLRMFQRLGPPTEDCQHRRARSTINWDGTVALCCATYEVPPIAASFVDSSPDELKNLKYSNPYCGTCMNSHVNKLYLGHDREHLDRAAVALLGPLYRAYLDEAQQVGGDGHVVFENRFISIMDAYDAGMKAMSAGRDSEAEAYFTSLVGGALEFGEGFFQAGQLAEKMEDQRKALQFYAEATRLAPMHEGYRIAWEATRAASIKH